MNKLQIIIFESSSFRLREQNRTKVFWHFSVFSCSRWWINRLHYYTKWRTRIEITYIEFYLTTWFLLSFCNVRFMLLLLLYFDELFYFLIFPLFFIWFDFIDCRFHFKVRNCRITQLCPFMIIHLPPFNVNFSLTFFSLVVRVHIRPDRLYIRIIVMFRKKKNWISFSWSYIWLHRL